VGLAAGIDGLVHLSDLSWNETGEAAVRNYKKGQDVEAIVLAVDVERERISLGIKQLDGDPFTTFVTVNDKGQTVTGKVKTVDARGAEIDLGDDIIGYLRASEISRDRVEDARSLLKEGDEVTAVVVNVDRKTRNIQLSIKAKDAADQNEAMASLSQQSSRENAGTTSLGALLRAKLDNNDSAEWSAEEQSLSLGPFGAEPGAFSLPPAKSLKWPAPTSLKLWLPVLSS